MSYRLCRRWLPVEGSTAVLDVPVWVMKQFGLVGEDTAFVFKVHGHAR